MEALYELTERTAYLDVTVMSRQTVCPGQEWPGQTPEGYSPAFLDTVFYGEEPAQLWAVPRTEGIMDVWLYRADGSRKILFPEIPAEYASTGFAFRKWYLDSEGNGYCWRNSFRTVHEDGHEKIYNTLLTKFSVSGEIQFAQEWDYGQNIIDLCQLSDGRIYLILENSLEDVQTLTELDSSTGLPAGESDVKLDCRTSSRQQLGGGYGLPLLYSTDPSVGNEILAVSPVDGGISCVFSFIGTTYYVDDPEMMLRDFKILPDGSILMLYASQSGAPATVCDRLTMSEIEKIPVVLRGRFNGDSWITRQASLFNRQNETYHVILEDCGGRNDPEDFARLTSIQIAAGKGPDIIYGGLMQDYIPGLMEKGALEDLSPYLQKSGILESDYFPAVFSVWRDGSHIYGVSPRYLGLSGFMVDSSILNTEEEPGIHDLIDSLLSPGKENTVFLSGYDPQDLLELFLKGSDTLWGMVNWEDMACDFSGELFTKILETAALYGDDGRRLNPSSIAEGRSFSNLFEFDSSEDMKRAGKTACGILFDDGCHAGLSSSSTMAISSSSANKDGAWEFIRFLLGEEVQSSEPAYYIPLRKKNFDAWLDAQLAEVRDGGEKRIGYVVYKAGSNSVISAEEHVYTENDITEEKAAEYRLALQEARSCPLRTLPILAIIREEAADYFNGSKTAETVGQLITNRVQVYLSELR